MSFWTNPFNLVAPELNHWTNPWVSSDATDAERSQAGIENYANDPYSGMPTHPNYITGYNPIAQQVSDINPNEAGLDAYRTEALRQGPSTWANLASQRARAEESAARDQLANESASGAATARSNIASRGGLTSGAQERINQAANLGYLQGSANLANQGGLNRQQIGINDEQNRITQLGALPGMENQLAQFKTQQKEFDVNQAVNEAQRQNEFNSNVYNQNMQAWAAGKQANATQKSGGSWLCTEAIKRSKNQRFYDEREDNALHEFKRYALKYHPKETRFYLYRCKKLVDNMNAEGVDWDKVLKLIKHVAMKVMQGEEELAFIEYFAFTKRLIDIYWPDCDNPIYLAHKEEFAA